MQDESQKIFLNIMNGLKYADPFLKVSALGAVMLLQFFLRMEKQRKLDPENVKDFSDFIRKTDGKYDIYNITAVDPEELTEHLESMGIRHMVLPDLNEEDNLIQVAVFQPDKDKFGAWFEQHLSGFMSGGEKEFRDLQQITKGKTSIVSFPLEGLEEGMEEDFRNLGINYAKLDDLHVGDGSIQMLIPNSDMKKVDYWYQLKKEDLSKAGQPVSDYQTLTTDQYCETGRVTEEDYVQNASPEYQKANEQYEGREKGELEKAVEEQEHIIKNENVIAFENYSTSPSYIPISINRESLLDHTSCADITDFQKHGMFACRVPGTWNRGDGSEEQLLVLPLSQVFESNDGRTYFAFLRNDRPPTVINTNTGNIIEDYASMPAATFVSNTFEKVEEKMLQIDQKKSLEAGKAINAIGKEMKPLKIPANPVKAVI